MTPQRSSSRPPEKAAGRSVELGHLIAIAAVSVPIFVAVGYWFHSDIQEARQSATDARLTAEKVLGQINQQRELLDEYRGNVARWSEGLFRQLCEAEHGRYNPNGHDCLPPDGHSFQYEPPFPTP